MNSEKANEFLREIPALTHDLPCSAELLQNLSAMVYDRSLASVEEIGEMIGRDQSFSAKTLALANSSFYGLQGKVSSVGRAVAVLGLREIRNMIFIIHYKRLASMLQPELLNVGLFLAHNLKVGMLARSLSGISEKGDPDELFTAGLLHDIGKILTALHRPDDWRRIIVDRGERSMWAAETAYWGLDHGKIGALALNAWNLPQAITEPVRCHHCPERASAFKDESIILSLADRFSLSNGYEQDDELLMMLAELGLDPESTVSELRRSAVQSERKASLLF
jgi:putative nucleotidyltransferase with HDIG domain